MMQLRSTSNNGTAECNVQTGANSVRLRSATIWLENGEHCTQGFNRGSDESKQGVETSVRGFQERL